MNSSRPEQAVRAVQDALQASLNNSLQALYLYGSLATGKYEPGYSDINLLAVVVDGTDLRAMYAALQPIWQAYGDTLVRAPLIVPRKRLGRHLHLQPRQAQLLQRTARPLLGSMGPLAELQPASRPDPRIRMAAHQWLADLSFEAMNVSALLVPELLGAHRQAALLDQLHCLYWKVTRRKLAPNTAVPHILADIHRVLDVGFQRLFPPPEMGSAPPRETQPLLPGQLASYDHDNNLLLVLPAPVASHLVRVDWSRLAGTLGGRYKGVEVVTPVQLRLIIQLADSIEFALGSYQHSWGHHPLEDIQLNRMHLFRTAARRPDRLQIADLPHAMLSSGKEEWHTVIHDFQNILLNIQLQNELLSRLQKVGRVRPPDLPDRNAPNWERLHGLTEQFDWWAEHYVTISMADDQK